MHCVTDSIHKIHQILCSTFPIYLLQTILELLRYISHVPMLLPHMTTIDTTVQGYLIPKGSQVSQSLILMPTIIIHLILFVTCQNKKEWMKKSYHFCHILLLFIIQIQNIFQPCLTRHIFSQLLQIESRSLKVHSH